jgi:serine/threonine protein kinase
MFLSDFGHLVLGDFGFSRNILSSEKCSTFIGSPVYTAPEIISRKRYSYEIDFWSYGIVLYELITGRVPFYGNSVEEIYKSILSEVNIYFLIDFSYELVLCFETQIPNIMGIFYKARLRRHEKA